MATMSHRSQAQSINSLPAELPGSTPDYITPSNDPSVTIPTRYKPSSNRRLQFEKTFRNPPLHRASKSSSTGISTAQPKLAQSDLKSLTEDCITRHSFDTSLRTPSSPKQVGMTSFDSARPYKESQTSLIQPTASFAPLASPERDEALPVLSETTIERNISTASTIAVVSVPRIAKRYVPNPIYIRKSVDKHRSLPTELPHVQSQSSLTEDLADWMDTSRVQSEKLQSAGWDTSSVVGSSSMSVVSCPVVSTMPLQHSEVRQKALEQRREAEEASISTPDSTNNDAKSSMQQITSQDSTGLPQFLPRQRSASSHDRAASIRSTSSTVSRKPLSPTAKVSYEVAIPETTATASPSQEEAETSSMTTHDAELTLLQQRMLSQTYITNDEKNEPEAQAIRGSSVLADTPDRASQTCINTKQGEETQADETPEPEGLGSLPDNPRAEDQEMGEETQARVQAKTSPESLPMPPSQSTVDDEQKNHGEAPLEPRERSILPDQVVLEPEEQTPPPAHPTATGTETEGPSTPPSASTTTAPSHMRITDVDKIALTPPPVLVKPMTAQAKRRAAHQRRMELAFGKA